MVVPPNVNLYFFTQDTIDMDGGQEWRSRSGRRMASGGALIEALLLRNNPDEDRVKRMNTEHIKPFQSIPNYQIVGEVHPHPAFKNPTGLYQVGQRPGQGCLGRIQSGESGYLSDVLFSLPKDVDFDVYWLCCRHAPTNSNNTSAFKKGNFGLENVASDMGLKPSQVKARGGRWR